MNQMQEVFTEMNPKTLLIGLGTYVVLLLLSNCIIENVKPSQAQESLAVPDFYARSYDPPKLEPLAPVITKPKHVVHVHKDTKKVSKHVTKKPKIVTKKKLVINKVVKKKVVTQKIVTKRRTILVPFWYDYISDNPAWAEETFGER